MNTRARGWMRIAALLAAETILVGVSGVPAAYAQFPDLQSEAECPGCAVCAVVLAAAALPFEGTWSTALTSADDARWTPQDFACVTACTAEGPVRALRFGCDKLGFVEQAERYTVSADGRWLDLALTDFVDPRKLDARR